MGTPSPAWAGFDEGGVGWGGPFGRRGVAATVGVTVLFTDLVDSTALSTSTSAANAEQLRSTHFRLLREALAANDGREVKNLGDGVMAVFPGVASALDTAVAIQRSFDRHNQSGNGPRLAIRVGLATGDCTEEDGDYFGEPVIQAARLCATAEGGQVLCTSVVGLLAPRDAYEFEPVGELELKGLPDTVATLEVAWVSTVLAPAAALPLPQRISAQSGLSRLVGRVSEREVLVAALKAARAGDRQLVLITGEAGLGKTRLAAEFAIEAFESGAVVVYGRCDEELAVPYLPWVEALGHLVEHLGDEALSSLGNTARAQLERLLPSLRERDEPLHSDERGSGDQYALFGAVTALVGRVVRDAPPLVLVLDDLHWADLGTLQLLRHLTTSLPQAPLLIVGTYRETDLGAADPLTETSARLHREPGVHRLPLSGLSDDETVELLEAIAGHELDETGVGLAHTLRADTAGNPFFATEVLRHLAETGALAQQDDGRWSVATELADLELPQSVRDVVGQRIRRLAPEAHPVLTAAAVVGREFATSVVAAATDLDEDEVLDLLEESMTAGLVAEVAGAVDRFTFTHALVQHTLYGELSVSRRARMHRRVATAIEQTVGGEPGELATHWFAAVQPAELDRAVGYAVEAGKRAVETAAPEEAVRWFTRAFEALEDGDPGLRAEVQVRLGDAERQAGHECYRERLLDAARRAIDLDRGDLVVRAALANYRGWHSASGEVDAERVAILEAALNRSDVDDGDRARLMATLAGELTYTDDPRRFDLVRDAEELGRSTGDLTVLLDALERVAASINVPEMLPERRRRASQMLELTEHREDPVRRYLALEQQSDVLLASADMEGVRRCTTERRVIAEQLGQPTFLWLVTNNEAILDLVEGDVDAAQAGAEKAFELGAESGQPDLMVYFGGLLMQIHMHRRQYQEIIPLVRERAEAVPGVSAFKAVLVNFLAYAGASDEVMELLAEMAADGFAFDRDLVWLTSTAMTAEAAAMVGDLDAAALLHDRLLPYADQVICTRAHCIGPVGYFLGRVAQALKRPEAADHFRDAMALGEGLRSPFHRARAMLGLAEVLQPTDPTEAGQLLDAVELLAEQYQMPGQLDGARALRNR